MKIEKKKDRIYVLLTDYPNKLSRLIKSIGLWEYSHVSISTERYFPTFYSFTGKKGFVTEDYLLHPTYKGEEVPCALFALPVTALEKEKIEEKIEQRKSRADLFKYSVGGLILLYLHTIPKQYKKDTCVGFVARTISECTSLVSNYKKELYNPNKFKFRFKEHLVFEGPLSRMSKKKKAYYR